MKDSELRELGPPETYDNTMLQNWSKCPRNFYWFMRGLDYKNPPAYFAFGRAWGVGINFWHSTQGLGHPTELRPMNRAERLAVAHKMAEEEWDKAPPIEFSNNTLENLHTMLDQYADAYGDEESWTMLYGKGELGFQLPIPGTQINYGGSIDAPIEWERYGILAREDKTTGDYITESFVNLWEHASQVTGYLWALHQILGEEPFGMYMNIASKRPRKDPELRFQRILVKRSEWQLASFMKTTILMADEIRNEYKRWLWPKYGERDPINCAGGMGRSPCLYRRLCLIEMEPWELEESYDFDQEFMWRAKWAPWEREGENE